MENNLKKIMYALIVVAVVLAGVLAYVWIERNGLVKDLKIEKDQLTAEMIKLQNDYANLTSDYDTLNVQLDAEREKVEQLIVRIQETDATNRAKIRQYEKELGTLRSIMKHYIYQIDSLNTLNNELRADAAKAREEAAESQRKYEEVVKVTEDLTSKVEQGQVVKGRGIILEGLNKSGAVTNRSSRVVKLRTSLSLVENEIAEKAGEGSISVSRILTECFWLKMRISSSFSTTRLFTIPRPVRWTITETNWTSSYISAVRRSTARVFIRSRSIRTKPCSVPPTCF